MKPAPPVTMTTFTSASGAHFGVRGAVGVSPDACVPLEVSDSIIAGAMTVDLRGLGYFEMLPSSVLEAAERG